MVGTLYKKGDARRDGGFSLFYMGINMGSFIAPLISGWLIKTHGWHWGFGIGGIGMLVALIIFRCFAVPAMKRYDSEVGPGFHLEQSGGEEKRCWWLVAGTGGRCGCRRDADCERRDRD